MGDGSGNGVSAGVNIVGGDSMGDSFEVGSAGDSNDAGTQTGDISSHPA